MINKYDPTKMGMAMKLLLAALSKAATGVPLPTIKEKPAKRQTQKGAVHVVNMTWLSKPNPSGLTPAQYRHRHMGRQRAMG